jgi:hypothetical protein
MLTLGKVTSDYSGITNVRAQMSYLMEDLDSIHGTIDVISLRRISVGQKVTLLKRLPISKHQYNTNHMF